MLVPHYVSYVSSALLLQVWAHCYYLIKQKMLSTRLICFSRYDHFMFESVLLGASHSRQIRESTHTIIEQFFPFVTPRQRLLTLIIGLMAVNFDRHNWSRPVIVMSDSQLLSSHHHAPLPVGLCSCFKKTTPVF